MTKGEIVDRIREIDEILASIRALGEEREMLAELLAEWSDGDEIVAALRGEADSEPPTEPGTPRTKSSQRMAAVKLDPCDACGGFGRVGAEDGAACGGRGVVGSSGGRSQ